MFTIDIDRETNYFETLGFKSNEHVSQEEIEQHYKTLNSKYNPAFNPDPAVVPDSRGGLRALKPASRALTRCASITLSDSFTRMKFPARHARRVTAPGVQRLARNCSRPLSVRAVDCH